MSINVQPNVAVSKENSTSLRLIKQKVKRGQNGSTEALSQNQELLREEVDPHTGRYELLSPQPPSFPKREDARSPVRHVDSSSASTVPGKMLPEVANNNTIPGTKKGVLPNNESSLSTALTTPPGSMIKKAEASSTNSKSSTIVHYDSPGGDVPALDMTQYEVGLDNLGNTCFMNSMLQCLLHIEPLVSFFLLPNIEHQLNLASPKKGALAMSFRQLVHDVYRKRSSHSVSPVNIQKAVCIHAPYLMDFQQQDSQEFLRFLLDGMSEDLCRKHSEQESITSPPAPSKSDAKSISSPSILPMLPQSATSSPATANHHTVMDFSRTAPAGSIEFGHSQEHSGRSHAGASQRLREETQRMRLSAEAAADVKSAQKLNHSDASAMQFPKLKNNNQGEEEGSGRLAVSVSGSGSCSNSKYVTRLRQQRSERSFDEEDRLSPLPSSSSVMPFSPGGSSTVITSAEKSRLNAVLRSADEGEDCSFEEPEGRSKSGDFGEQDTPSRRLRRPARARRDESIDNASSSSDVNDLSASVTKNLALSGVDPQLWTRIIHAEKEARVAWGKYLKLNDSVITDIFAGQLQSTIECSTCHHRSSSYDPFLDLSVPIYRESDNQPTRSSFLGTIRNSMGGGGSSASSGGAGDANKSTLEKCLEKFTAAETLEGDNMYMCEKCKTKRKSVKQLSIYKYPQVLVIHIKRFKYSSTRREKLSTDVHFPLSGLDLSPYVSPDLPSAVLAVSHNNAQESAALTIATHNAKPAASSSASIGAQAQPVRPPPLYDLIGVSNHHGSLNSGHYIAHVDTTGGRAEKSRWMCFNDSRVSAANANGIAGPTAYVLFYRLKQQQS